MPSRFWDRIAPQLVILASFPVVGYFIGWYVGASSSPVVAVLIPIIAGLIGAISFGLLDRKAALTKLLEVVGKLQEDGTLPAATVNAVEMKLGDRRETSLWLPASWAFGVILFCCACYLGTNSGAKERIPETCPLVSDLLVLSDQYDQPTRMELAELHRLRLYLLSKKIPAIEIRDLFRQVIGPVFLKDELERLAMELPAPKYRSGVAPAPMLAPPVRMPEPPTNKKMPTTIDETDEERKIRMAEPPVRTPEPTSDKKVPATIGDAAPRNSRFAEETLAQARSSRYFILISIVTGIKNLNLEDRVIPGPAAAPGPG